MKRIHYDGQTLDTGDHIAEAIQGLVVSASRMDTTSALEVPVLDSDDVIRTATIVIGTGTHIEIEDLEMSGGAPEAERFPMFDIPTLGGVAVAVSEEDDPRPEIGIQ